MDATASPVAAVVVDHHAGEALGRCLDSLRAEGASPIVVVDNAEPSDARPAGATGARGAAGSSGGVEASDVVITPGRNLGYGAGVNRGLAAVDTDLVLVCNPDVVLEPGALGALVAAVESDPTIAFAGPKVLGPDGRRYPSARRFPSVLDAVGHAALAPLRPQNRFSRRYRMEDADLDKAGPVGWVSGSCFLARRRALEELGGFDESYFMYLEDTDLGWRAARAGWSSWYVPQAVVSHLQGVSTARHPYRMLAAHHRSALRFEVRRDTGWRRLLVVPAAAVLGLRLVVASARTVARRARRWAD